MVFRVFIGILFKEFYLLFDVNRVLKVVLVGVKIVNGLLLERIFIKFVVRLVWVRVVIRLLKFGLVIVKVIILAGIIIVFIVWIILLVIVLFVVVMFIFVLIFILLEVFIYSDSGLLVLNFVRVL